MSRHRYGPREVDLPSRYTVAEMRRKHLAKAKRNNPKSAAKKKLKMAALREARRLDGPKQ